jgi:hopanoid-associated sugar epimerase
MTRLSLVTGGGGFVGRHLVHLLRERGERVRVLDLAGAPGLPPDVEIVTGSILDAGKLRQAMTGAGRVYHLAANPNLWARDPETFMETNYRGTQAVLAAAAAANPERIVHTSTESILKSYRRPIPDTLDETVSWTVDDMPGPYCRSKFLAEQAAMAAARDGMPVVIVNPTLPIGPGDTHLTPPTRMLLDFLSGKAPAYLDCVFNLVDVRTVALGHILAADKGRIGERYILGGWNIAVPDLLQLLRKLSGRRMPRLRIPYWLAWTTAAVSESVSYVTKRPPIAPLTGVRLARTPMRFDSSKAVRELGLPVTPLEASLADALAWFVEQRLLPPLVLST